MRSCGNAAAAVLLAFVVAAGLHAQSSDPGELYKEALTREGLLRKELDAYKGEAPPVDLLARVRVLIGSYQDISGLFPASDYSDNALWQGGVFAADVFRRFGDAGDRSRAQRLLNALATRFPGSTFAPQVSGQITRLNQLAARPAVVASTGPVGPVGPIVSTPPPPAAVAKIEPPSPPAVAPRRAATPATPVAVTAPSSTVMLRAIRRETLPDALRVTIELDREIPFREERIEGPARVFVDLQNTRAVDSLRDATIPVNDEVVRQIRVGRQLDSRTRVVFDLATSAPYSVYSLYNPYRVVIDFERRPPAGAAAAPPLPAVPVTAKPTVASVPATVAAPAPLPPSTNAAGGFSLSRQLGLGVARIVIDPGHGGYDPGARIKGLTEAGLVLDVALRLEKLLKKEKNVDVVLTRRSNAHVTLEERTAIANKSEADLFLSIHANASAVATVRGVETYFLNFAPNPEAEATAARENAGSSRSMRELPDIVEAIAMNNKREESRDFAAIVQATLYERLRKVNRNLRNLGVKQAPFMVLIGASMPAVLAEISFMTNSQEATLLKTEKYRQQIAEALLAGVMKYQEALKKAPAIAAQ